MTTLTTHSGAGRIDQVFAAVIGFCADFCAGARQGLPPVPPSFLTGRRR